ncbi:SIS domain-containing protein [Simkania negevensis]|uniref:SIS domain-containing protein n=1 Tax=Simkania negevensis TaxID=83561 RepID=A0ABS3ARA4_9BACT|nr:SIS domain-containing protein [Simkania negevensis]
MNINAKRIGKVAEIAVIGLLDSSFFADIDYIFCLDGGGSKTHLQVLNVAGHLLPIGPVVERQQFLRGRGCNVMTLSFNNAASIITELVEKSGVAVERAAVVGGFAGAGSAEKKEALHRLFCTIGFAKNKIVATSDSDLLVSIIENEGVLLISGTGSICIGKKNGNIVRFGGLGPLVGDEGSAFYMGRQAVRAAALAQQGERTALTKEITALWGRKKLNKMAKASLFASEEIANIASLVPILFRCARLGDGISQAIVKENAHHLAALVASVQNELHTTSATLYLHGGVFQDEYADSFVEQIKAAPSFIAAFADAEPLIINIAGQFPTTSAVQDKLLACRYPSLQRLLTLPVPSSSFKKRYENIACCQELTTEERHPLTMEIDKVLRKDIVAGLNILHSVDTEAAKKLLDQGQQSLAFLLEEVVKTFEQGGRVFLVGAGSSGRVAQILVAKWREYCRGEIGERIIALMAGGPKAFVRAEEGQEDSFDAGYQIAQKQTPCCNDLFLLISASGVARYNFGAATAAEEAGARVLLLCNTTQRLAAADILCQKTNASIVVIDVGPQAITGSTRLQAANASLLALGSVFYCVMQKLQHQIDTPPSQLIQQYQHALQRLPAHFDAIATLIRIVCNVLAADHGRGCVTYLGTKSVLREIMTDTTELPPTFSLQPPRVAREKGKGRAEFRAYLLGSKTNSKAWEQLLGRPLIDQEKEEVQELMVAQCDKRWDSFISRAKGVGNAVIVVTHELDLPHYRKELVQQAALLKKEGANVSILFLHTQPLDAESNELLGLFEHAIPIQLPNEKDPMQLISTLLLKHLLNHVSNAAMALMGKLWGNIMIDLAPSNKKLLDRALRIIKEKVRAEDPRFPIPDDYTLRQLIVRSYHYKSLMEKHRRKPTPSSIQIALSILKGP